MSLVEQEELSLARMFGATVQLVRRRFETSLEAAVAFRLPFRTDGLLLVLSGCAPDVIPVLTEACGHAPRRSTLICLRRPELHELALPNLHAMETVSLPWWIKEAGMPLFGADIRPMVPAGCFDARLFANYLTATTHYIRNHVILQRLARHDYSGLLRALHWRRALLMMAALLLRGVWRVYPDTVAGEFLDGFDDAALRENVLESAAADGLDGQDAMRTAHRAVWLYEQFIRGLWRYAR